MEGAEPNKTTETTPTNANSKKEEGGGGEQAKDGDEVCVFVKKRRPRGNVRDRKRDAAAAVEDQTPSAVASRNVRKKHGLTSTTKKEEEEEKQKEKEKEEAFAYSSTHSAVPVGGEDSMATASIETETEHDRDAMAIAKRSLEMGKARAQESIEDGKIYKGAKNYAKYLNAREAPKGARAGPVRASLHIRMSCRFDYQPDLCKDYKETGYCGYGDSCKFMHDRGDYKAGWQIEQEWQEKQKQGTVKENNEVPEEEDEDDLPWACWICRQPFVDPVVTKCQHYFCEKCALKHFAKNSKCAVCLKQTGGIFNPAHKIREKIAQGKLKPPPQEEGENDEEDGEEVDPEKARDEFCPT